MAEAVILIKFLPVLFLAVLAIILSTVEHDDQTD